MSSDQLIERWCKDHATPTTVQWLVDNFEPAEGSSIRRSILYNFYLEHCLGLKVEALNPASFGKLIHSVFLGLKTRRLGTRGNSKYHYYGIQVKSSSALIKQMPFDGDLLLLSNINYDFDNQSVHLNMSPNENIFSPLSTQINNNNNNTHNHNNHSSVDFLFPHDTLISNELPSEITMNDIKIFQKTHDDYSTKLHQAFLKFQYDLIEKLIQQFWSLTNINYSQANDLTNNDPMIIWKFNRICTLPFILDQIRLFYSKFYQTIIDSYFPNVLISLTQTTIEAIRTIANNISYWLIHTIEHLYDPLKSILIQYTQAFSSILLRYTSLNHLSLTVQTMFLQSSRLITMSNDLTHINFNDLHEQINWLIECDLNLFIKIEQCFKNLFQCQTMLTINNWTTFIDTLLDDYLILYNNTKEYIYNARQFLLKTNFYCTLILRELTLHYGTSLGSFHLLQLFIEEYLYYRIEQKISFYLNQSIINLVIENINNEQQQQKYLMNKNYQYFFNDDDIDDDFESLSDDFNDHRNILKPLSPVQIDDFILPNETITNSFSYIFEDLQPLSNEIF
ncbi:unnamed protein product [Rotaria sp. Silwood1]|nr:unnamed protein product [Rotaria sp. Silwood1]CAF0770950.1 unnamed protein product [Rotaria sp. Silwood1]CAF3321580.1 unnamed protein product [Rotaria sp. Silwood1]CAF3344509.1 unnamed protein product [Rotaria sp. Silwood1]CAF4521422.1 unnamed protein product [Rotaria sp. Silwood1]